MWKNDTNKVSKMLKEESKETIVSSVSKCFMIYPQTNKNKINKIRLTTGLGLVINIFTPLVVIINFYI